MERWPLDLWSEFAWKMIPGAMDAELVDDEILLEYGGSINIRFP